MSKSTLDTNDNFDYLGVLKMRAEAAKSRTNDQTDQTNQIDQMDQMDQNLDTDDNKKNDEDLVFIDVFKIASIKTDIDSLNFPLFSLKKNAVTAESVFINKNVTVTITPSQKGQATIHDKDIWIYCVSKLAQAMYEKKEIKPTVRFKLADFLKTVGRNLSGRSHLRTKDALDRLDGTRIKLEIQDNKRVITQKFGLIEGWTVIENRNGRMSYIQITLPNWLIQSLKSGKVRKIASEYFNLSSAIDRRVYEIACKHCNNNTEWAFKLENLQYKCGSTSSVNGFRRAIRQLAEKDNLPDYHVIYDREKDIVKFINRDPIVHERAARRATNNIANQIIKKV